MEQVLILHSKINLIWWVRNCVVSVMECLKVLIRVDGGGGGSLH